MKAVSGQFGPLAEWQRVGYQLGLDQGTRCDRLIWGTPYYPAEGYDYGETTRSGYPCSLRVAASNTLPGGKGPPHWFVWTERSGIRQVLDTGAKWNDAEARERGAEFWVDMWVWEARDFPTGIYRAAVVERRRREAGGGKRETATAPHPPAPSPAPTDLGEGEKGGAP